MDSRSLSDALISLQRQDLSPLARQTVEEAVALLGTGREMEAHALLEKAQALAALGSAARPESKSNGSHQPGSSAEQFAARLAADITGVLTRAIQELQHYSAEQTQTLALTLEKRIRTLEDGVRPLAGLPERCDQLAQGFAAQFESLTARLDSHEERFAAIDRMAQEFAAVFAGANERLDRHSEMLRAIEQRHARRAAVINDVLGTLAKLREQNETQPAAEAAA